MVTGKRYANGVEVNPDSLTAVSAYVQQADLFLGVLTVYETLRFQVRNSTSHLRKRVKLKF